MTFASYAAAAAPGGRPARAEELRTHRAEQTDGPLKGKTIALMFEKPSLRTRVSFTVGVHELGGFALEIDSSKTKDEEP